MRRNKIVCILDADAGSHLRDISLNRKSIYKLLEEEFLLMCVNRVNIEAEDGRTVRPDKLKEFARLYRNAYKTTQEMVPDVDMYTIRHLTPLIGGFWDYPNAEQDAGERHSITLGYHLIRSGRENHFIFLSDDEKAREKFLNALFQTYPIGCLWSSWDLLLYLYVRYGGHTISHDEIIAALRTLNAVFDQGGSIVPPSEKLIKRFSFRVQQIKKIDDARRAGLD